MAAMNCRPDCGAWTALSITSPIPGMLAEKPAGVRCVQLAERERCRLFGRLERPAVCLSRQAAPEMCGASRHHTMAWLDRLESQTTPG